MNVLTSSIRWERDIEIAARKALIALRQKHQDVSVLISSTSPSVEIANIALNVNLPVRFFVSDTQSILPQMLRMSNTITVVSGGIGKLFEHVVNIAEKAIILDENDPLLMVLRRMGKPYWIPSNNVIVYGPGIFSKASIDKDDRFS